MRPASPCACGAAGRPEPCASPPWLPRHDDGAALGRGSGPPGGLSCPRRRGSFHRAAQYGCQRRQRRVDAVQTALSSHDRAPGSRYCGDRTSPSHAPSWTAPSRANRTHTTAVMRSLARTTQAPSVIGPRARRAAGSPSMRSGAPIRHAGVSRADHPVLARSGGGRRSSRLGVTGTAVLRSRFAVLDGERVDRCRRDR